MIVLNGRPASRRPSSCSRIDEFGTPVLQPLRGRLGARDGHALPVDEAGGIALGRDPKRHDRPLAGGIRPRRGAPQFHHVIDVAADRPRGAGLPEPTCVHGVQQRPLQGTSMASTLRRAGAPERHETQYFEMFCNRGIYHQGWTAVTRHSIPWMSTRMPAFDDDVWELYAPDDWTQAHTSRSSRRSCELQRLFLIEAATTCCPSTTAGSSASTPSSPGGRSSSAATRSPFGGMGRLSENSVLDVKNKSYSITARSTCPRRAPRA